MRAKIYLYQSRQISVGTSEPFSAFSHRSKIDTLDRTYIFTFDSLGTKHPAAARNLSHYLQLEAKDKKSLDETTPPSAATALVSSHLHGSE